MIPGSATPLFLPNQGDSAFKIERSLRFNSADSAYLNRTPSSAGNRKTWTWSGWIKRSAFASQQAPFTSSDGATATTAIYFSSSDKLVFYTDRSGVITVETDGVLRDPSAWYHAVVAIDTTQATSTNRVKIYLNGVQQTVSGTYPAQNFETEVNRASFSHKIGGLTSAWLFNGYLADVHFIDGQALAPTDFGEYDDNNNWNPKDVSGLTYGTNGFHLDFSDNSSNAALGTDSSGNNNDWTVNNLVAAASTVPSYTVTNSSTAANAFDGSFSTVWSANSGTQSLLTFASAITGTTFRFYIGSSLNTTGFQINGTTPTNWTGANADGWVDFSSHINGSLSSIRVAFTPNQYKQSLFAIEIDGTVLVDYSSSNIDSLVDTPTNYEAGSGNNGGNYCTWNSLAKGSNVTLSNGNLDASTSTTSGYGTVLGTIGVSSGKWYWEFTGGSGTLGVGLGIAEGSKNLDTYLGTDVGYEYYSENGNKYSSAGGASYGSSYGTGDVIGVALDVDNGTLAFYKNGVSQGTAYTGLTNTPYFPAVADSSGTNVLNGSINFGQRPFAYTPPTGYKSLCTTNLTDPTIADGSTAMDVALYTGNGSTQTISGLGFSPDLVWIKCRSTVGVSNQSHNLLDTVRGALARLQSNTTAAESSANQYGSLSAFTSDGFTVIGGSTNADQTNANNIPYVAWTWDAGTSTVSNTDGSITSSVRANPSAGFSISKFTTDSSTSGGATIGHGLNAAPGMYIYKPTSTTGEWVVVHSYDYDQFAFLNATTQFRSISSQGGGTPADPTSSVLTLYDLGVTLASKTYVCYAFAPVEGYSAFGSYTGNGSSTFVYTGFRPKFILWKNTDTSGSYWLMTDSSRNTYNVVDGKLYAQDSSQELFGDMCDFLSNGFRLIGSSISWNSSGDKFIYYAVAENPFKYARAR